MTETREVSIDTHADDVRQRAEADEERAVLVERCERLLARWARRTTDERRTPDGRRGPAPL